MEREEQEAREGTASERGFVTGFLEHFDVLLADDHTGAVVDMKCRSFDSDY